jgi:hypothetical protein
MIFARKKYHVFSGYYDISPFSGDDSKILAIQIQENSGYGPGTASIGYYDLNDPGMEFHLIEETATWCWQQGCRLQWYPKSSSQTIAYNTMVDGSYGAVIQNIITKQHISRIRRPLYAISNDGKLGLSLDFSRLQRLRPGYGYGNIPDETTQEEAPGRSGIWSVDLSTKEERFLFSIADIAGFMPLDTMKGAIHYFNHILFSPDGTRFLFFHIWNKNGKRYTRLITCNRDGSDLYALINEGHVSHYAWKNSEELFAYATHHDTGTHYYLYKDKSNDRKIIANNILCEDGHPSFLNLGNGEYILLDSYPNFIGCQKLMLYNFKKNSYSIIGRYFSPRKFKGEIRCDLHPRGSNSGRYIAFDAVNSGERCLHVLDSGQYVR